MNDQKIIDNSQENDNEVHFIGSKGFEYLKNPFKPNRSLADIKELVKLRKVNEELHQQIIDQDHDHKLEMKDFKWFGE
jgi:hypothetical protein